MSQQVEIKILLKRLKTLHPLWESGSGAYRNRLKESLELDIKRLEQLGVARYYSDNLLENGHEYPIHIVENSKIRNGSYLKTEDVAAIFGAGYEHIRELTPDEKKASALVKEKKNKAISSQIPLVEWIR